jgi:hypothetical protein
MNRLRLVIEPVRRQMVGAVVILTAISSIYLSWRAVELKGQLDSNVLVETVSNRATARELPKALACMSLAGNVQAIRKLELPCDGERRITFITAKAVTQRWLASTGLLVLIALLAIAFLHLIDRTFPLRTRLFGSHVIIAVGNALTLAAFVSLGLSYGIVSRPLNPPYVKIDRGNETLCEGYKLTDTTLYNPNVGAIEHVPNGKSFSPPLNGQNRDIIRDRYLYLLSEKNPSPWSCRLTAGSAPG